MNLDKSKTKKYKYRTKSKTYHKKSNLFNLNLSNSTHNHNQHKFYDRKSDIFKFQYTPKLKGGKFIDKGGFGCVVTPALACSRSDKNLNTSISKIIKHNSDSLNKELKLNTILNKLDPYHKFYVTVEKSCVINEIPKSRTDLTNVKYRDDKLSKFNINSHELTDKYGTKKRIDKNFCDIDLDLKPVNLIMPYAGISLTSIMKTNMKSDSIRGQMHTMFITNLKLYFKHLVIGLVKMHNNRIVNKDIKQRNIMLQLLSKPHTEDDNDDDDDDNHKNTDSNIMIIRYIDFGLSEFLTKEFCENIDNIDLKGTPYYISPEIFVSDFIIKYKDRSESYQKTKIMHYIQKHVYKTLSILGEKTITAKLKSTIDILYNKIKYLYEKDRLLLAYFGSDNNKFNGYLQKADVYALGISIYETLYRYSNINIRKNNDYRVLYDLLSHMIEMNPDNRYNIIQCLSHSYFTGK